MVKVLIFMGAYIGLNALIYFSIILIFGKNEKPTDLNTVPSPPIMPDEYFSSNPYV